MNIFRRSTGKVAKQPFCSNDVELQHRDAFSGALADDFFSLDYELCGKHIKNFDGASGFVAVPRGSQTSETVIVFSDGQLLKSSLVKVGSEHVIDISLCAPDAASDAYPATIEVRCAKSESKQSSVALATFELQKSAPNTRHNLRIGLAQFANTNLYIEMEVHGRDGNTARVGISKFLVCSLEQIGRANALSNYDHRLRNEISHFSGTAYTHSMYGSSRNIEAQSLLVERYQDAGKPQESFLSRQESMLREKIQSMAPTDGESVYGFACRCLGSVLSLAPPDFYQRISQLRRGRPIRILSLCSGAARIEEEILNHAEEQVELTLFDASEDLIKRAAARLPSDRHKVRCLIGDINAGIPNDGSFDVIVCVSALHHVADLERVVSQINERLAPDGEFWSIGEQIGRNGNRLWPEALYAANLAFGKLPERYRRNAHTTAIDETLSDDDFSTGCFEGIRSEELEKTLERFLIPVDVYKRNCFLWRFIDITYCDNFNLTSPEDLDYLRELIVAEAMHWVAGGRGTEMHAVFRRRHFLTT
jgi:SAM-dependent methyltransferase